jgi:glycosyltransferase involved in cell wall biosynthesis
MKGLLYFPRLLKKKTNADRLIMNILCRNEVDIIECNIRVHSLLGVDAFAVMDNGSTDGTREKLAELSKEFEIKIIDQTGVYNQRKWMRQLVFVARDELGASWVISNDADEFWLPKSKGSIKDLLNHADSVVTIKRSNMLLTEQSLEEGYHFSQANYRVKYPVCYDKNAEINEENIAMFFADISPKVVVNPYGFIKISGGNHRAKHLASSFTKRTETSLRVYHYPVRSYQQFEDNIKQRIELLQKNARMGNHYRRWAKLYENGELRAEFGKFIIDEDQVAVLEGYSIIAKDLLPSDIMQQVKFRG